jgi:hypothetical protein
MCFNDLLQRGVVHSKGTKALGDVGKTVAQRFKASPGMDRLTVKMNLRWCSSWSWSWRLS